MRRQTHQSSKSVVAPLLLWLALQLAVLCLAASRVELSAHFIKPAQRLAIVEMLVVQIAATGMMFPYLLRDARCCIALMLSAAPMLALAGMLSKRPAGVIAGAWTCLSLWLLAWTIVSTTTLKRERSMAIAIANVVGVGGMVLWYLSSEFGGEVSARFFPLVSVVKFVCGWEALIVALISNLAVVVGTLSWSALRPRKH